MKLLKTRSIPIASFSLREVSGHRHHQLVPSFNWFWLHDLLPTAHPTFRTAESWLKLMLKHRPWSYAWHCSNRSIAAAVVKVLHLACHFGHNGGEKWSLLSSTCQISRCSSQDRQIVYSSTPRPCAVVRGQSCPRQSRSCAGGKTIEVLVAPLCTFFGWVSWIYFDATCMWVEIPVKPEVCEVAENGLRRKHCRLDHGMSLECGWWPVDDGWVYLLHFWVPLWNISSDHGG